MKNGKKGPARAAKAWWRTEQKIARKTPGISLDEAKAKFDGKIADLRTQGAEQAAELPKLRAENERLKNKRDEFIFRVAQLAALINPKLFEEHPETAIKLALKRLRDTGRILGEIAQEKEPKEARAVADAAKTNLANARTEYQRGVKLITNELKNWDRALDKFKRYVTAKKLTEGSSLEKVLEQYRRHGFTGPELVRELKEFTPWWKQEKSGRAKKAAKKRGQVKRKATDLRSKENRRHKQGYCQVCGKRVRPRQRRCAEHAKGKPFLVYSGTTDLAELRKLGHRPLPD